MLFKKIIIFTLIAVIEFGSFPVDAFARAARPAAEVEKEQFTTLITDAKPSDNDTITFTGQGHGVKSIVPALADQQASNLSAGFEETAKVHKLAKQDYRPNEEIDVVIENGAHKEYKTELIDAIGNKVALDTEEVETGAAKVITIEQPSSFRPGKYTLRITDNKGGVSEQDFSWGVLAINPDKSIYAPNETATLAIGVLDEGGDMVCDAQVELQITSPTGSMTSLSTDNGKIVVNEECKSHEFTLKPDYEATYQTGGVGVYKMVLKSQTKNGSFSITDSFEVKESIPFDVKRVTATRIYPPNTYPVTMEITANQDFEGTVSETVPGSFKIARPGEDVKTDTEVVDAIVSTDFSATASADILAPDALPKRNEPVFDTDAVIAYNTINTVGDFDGGKAVLGASIPGLGMPFSGMYRVTQEFGQSLVYDEYGHGIYDTFGMNGHDGIDFAMPEGTPLLAVDNGKVLLAGAGDYGTTIVIQHAWGRSYYGHLSTVDVKEGDEVQRGATIARSGNTGLSTGPHLHFGIKPDTNDSNNGYYGKVDPAYYLGLKVSASQVLGVMTKENVSNEFSTFNSQLSTPSTDVQILTWKISVKKGDKIKIGYNYLAPRISPQFYTLGPATFTDTTGKEVFHEIRKWQIASDALDYKFKRGTFQKSISTSCAAPCAQTVRGVGFKPKAVIFEWTLNTAESWNAHQVVGMGFATSDTQERAVSYWSEDNIGTSDTGGLRSSTKTIVIQQATDGTVLAQADFVSFDTDGFTLNWTTNDANAYLISYTAIGGADVNNVKAGSFILDTSEYTQAVTDPGFQPDFVMFLANGGGLVEDANVPNASMSAGFASSPNKEGAVSMLTRDNQSTQDSYRAQRTDASILLLSNTANGAIDAAADIRSFDSSGFTLNMTDLPALKTHVYYLAIKGGQYDVGSFSQPTLPQAQSVYTGFRPSGLMTIAASQSASGAIAQTATLSTGGASRDSGGQAWCNDTTGTTCTAPGVQLNAASDWCNDTTGVTCTSSWSTRKKITFNNASASADLVDFPVLVKLDATNIDYTKTQNSGQDIRFVDPANPNLVLSYEIESWNESGTSHVWVKVPQLDAGSTSDYIWMYYGNANAPDGQDASNVWDSNHNIVYHMEETSGTSLSDSAGTAQNGTKLSATEPNPTGSGKIDGAQDFDGTNDYVETSSPSLPTGDFTYSFWVNADTVASTRNLIMVSDGAGVSGNEFRIYATSGALSIYVDNTLWNTTTNLSSAEWTHLVISRSGSTTTLHKNGILQAGSLTDGTALNFSTCGMLLGVDADANCNGTLGGFLNGRMDEVRVSNTARSQSWIMASYLSENGQMNTFGSEQLYTEQQSTSGWIARKKIMFNNIASSEDLTNFPVLVALSAGKIDYAKTQNSGQDIRFVDPSDPNIVLPHEIESWNESGTSYVWVKVPKIDKLSNTDHIWMYYGNASASDGQDTTNVWNENYKAIWHLKEDPSTAGAGGILDATSNNVDGTDNGSMAADDQVTGKDNGSLDFDGSDDYIDIPETSFDSIGAMTLSLWVKPGNIAQAGFPRIIQKGDPSGATRGFGIGQSTTGGVLGGWYQVNYLTTEYSRETSVTVSNGTWYHVTMVYNGATNVDMYVNGALANSGASAGWSAAADDMRIADKAGGSGSFTGGIDEIRISSTNRSAEWIEAEYRSTNDQMNTFGNEEIYGTSGLPYSQSSLWSDDLDAQNIPTSNTNTNSDTTKVIRFAASPTAGGDPRTVATAEMQSFDSTGFTVNWTEADSTTRLVLYWAAGSVNASQEDYRWYKNANAETPTTALEDENSPTILAKNKPYARLRTNISTGGNGLNASTQGFKLQYATNQAEAAIGGTTDWCNDTTGITCTAPLQSGDEVPASTTTDWCNDTSGVTCTTDWSTRRKITFNNASASAALTDFPVLVKLDSTRIDYSKTQNAGQDIRFVDPADPTTALSHQIETWNESGTSYAWVKVPTINGQSNTDYIWMYYGNSSVSDGQDASNVWDSNYHIVYHMDESSGNLVDSAGTAQNAVRGGSAVTQTTGEIGYGQDFNSTGYTSTSNPSLPTGDFAYEVWVKYDNGADETIFMSSDGAASSGSEIRLYTTTSIDSLAFTVDLTGPTIDKAPSVGTWHHFAFSRSGSRTIYYHNGVPVNSVNDGSTLDFLLDSDGVTQCELFLGVDVDTNCNGGLANYFDGQLDEFRVSNASRNGDWMSASYLSGADLFNTYGSEMTQAETKLSATGWQYRKKIQFNNASASAALTDFPVMVKLDASRIDYNKTQDDGGDIRFVDPADNTTVLAHEIETWNENGTSVVWVKVPSLAAGTEDYIWMYYGNPGASDGQAATSVWDSNYNAVWHLKEDPAVAGAGGILDSTSNNNDGTDNGSMNVADQVTGQVNGSLDFDGTDDYINVAHNANLDFGNRSPFLISFWMNGLGPNGGFEGVIAKDSNTRAGWEVLHDDNNNAIIMERRNASGTYLSDCAITYTPSQWTHVVFRYDGTDLTCYSNLSIIDNAQDDTGAMGTTTDDLTIGTWQSNASFWGGRLDEIRISSDARSDDWIEAEYHNGLGKMSLVLEEQAYAISGTNVVGWRDVADAWCNDTSGISCNTSWAYRKRITINNQSSSTNLTNFPILVKLDASRIDYGKTQSDGDDIRFVDPNDPTTVLSHEIETWNESGESFIWVKVPQIDANSTTDSIWMYYGNESATNGQDATNVWDTNFKGVWHLSETGNGTAGEFNDSTSNAFNGRGGNGTSSMVPTKSAAKISDGQTFDVADDFINVAYTATLAPTDFISIEAWAKFPSIDSGTHPILSKTEGGGYNLDAEADLLRFRFRTGGVTRIVSVDFSDNVTANAWTHIAGTYDGTTGRLYVNGVQVSTLSTSGNIEYSNNNDLQIGAEAFTGATPDTSVDSFGGSIDESRISNSVRSADWIKAEYLTSSDQMNTFGNEETQTTSEWRYKDNAGVSNGATITASVLGTSTTGNQLTYQESNITGLNPTAIAAGEKREFDFSLDGSLASNRRTYYFRLVNADGTPLTNYTRYPTLTVGVPNKKVMRGGKFFNYKATQPFTF